jgi:hypothetical protein
LQRLPNRLREGRIGEVQATTFQKCAHTYHARREHSNVIRGCKSNRWFTAATFSHVTCFPLYSFLLIFQCLLSFTLFQSQREYQGPVGVFTASQITRLHLYLGLSVAVRIAHEPQNPQQCVDVAGTDLWQIFQELLLLPLRAAVAHHNTTHTHSRTHTHTRAPAAWQTTPQARRWERIATIGPVSECIYLATRSNTV